MERKYNLVKQFNKELKSIGQYILNAAFCEFIMTRNTPNGEIPVREDRLTTFGNIAGLCGEHLFTGCFEYHDGNSVKNMYIVVNNSTTENTVAMLTFNKPVALCLIHRSEKKQITANKMNIGLDSGDACIIIEDE